MSQIWNKALEKILSYKMAKFIVENKVYQIQGYLAVLISNAAFEEDPLKALLLLGRIKEYLRENNDIEEII